MNERQKTLLRLACSFLLSNMQELDELFGTDLNPNKLDYNGEIIDYPKEDELEEIMKVLG